MSIEIAEIVKALDLNDDQTSKIGEIQNTFNDVLQKEIDNEKSGVLNKNQQLLDELKQAKEKMMPEGIDIEEFKQFQTEREKILEEKRKAEEDKLIASENWDKLKSDMAANHEKNINEIKSASQNEISELKNALNTTIIENDALKAIEEAKGNHTLLMPHVKESLKVVKDAETNKYKTIVVDEKGNEKLNPTSGEAFSVKDLISELQADERFTGAFPTMNQGSNTNVNINNTNYTTANNPFDKKSKAYSITEQARIRKENPTQATKLKQAADNS